MEQLAKDYESRLEVQVELAQRSAAEAERQKMEVEYWKNELEKCKSGKK